MHACIHTCTLTHTHTCTQVFIAQLGYPKWTPVTVVTEGGEPPEFSNHFPSWPHFDLSCSQRAAELKLPYWQRYM